MAGIFGMVTPSSLFCCLWLNSWITAQKPWLLVENCNSGKELSVNQVSFELGKVPVEVICE